MGSNPQTTNVAGLTHHLDDPAGLRIASGARVLDFLAELQDRMADESVTQAELARRVGVPEQQVSRWLAAEQSITAKTLFCLAAGLGFDIDLQWVPRECSS